MSFLHKLLSGAENEVDSVVTAGLLALMTLIALTVFVVVLHPEVWNPITFATGAGTLIGATAGGKTARDHWCPSAGAKPDDDNAAH